MIGSAVAFTKREAIVECPVRYSVKGNTLFVILLGQPREVVALYALSTNIPIYKHEIDKISLLETGETLRWIRDTEALKIQMPPPSTPHSTWILRIDAKQAE